MGMSGSTLSEEAQSENRCARISSISAKRSKASGEEADSLWRQQSEVTPGVNRKFRNGRIGILKEWKVFRNWRRWVKENKQDIKHRIISIWILWLRSWPPRSSATFSRFLGVDWQSTNETCGLQLLIANQFEFSRSSSNALFLFVCRPERVLG